MTKKFFAGLLLVFMLASVSCADVAYTTSNGKMGYIAISTVLGILSADSPVVMYTDAADNALAAHYYNESGTSYIALIEPESDKSVLSGDTAYIFNASNLTEPVNNGIKTLKGTYNTHSAAFSENHRGLFLASGVKGEATISEFNTDELEFVRSFSYITSNDAVTMSSVMTNGSNIFCLVKKATPDNSLILRFDGQLDDRVRGYSETKVRYDSEIIAFGKDNRIFIAHSGGVDTLTNGEPFLLVSTDTPVKALCKDKDGGFYFMTQNSDGEQVLAHYVSIDELNEVDSGLSDSLVSKLLYYNSDNKKFVAAIIGDCIAIYDSDTDELIAEFTSSQLGGIPISITASTQNTSSTSESSSSSCNATGAGLFMMLLSAGYVFMKRK